MNESWLHPAVYYVEVDDFKTEHKIILQSVSECGEYWLVTKSLSKSNDNHVSEKLHKFIPASHGSEDYKIMDGSINNFKVIPGELFCIRYFKKWLWWTFLRNFCSEQWF